MDIMCDDFHILKPRVTNLNKTALVSSLIVLAPKEFGTKIPFTVWLFNIAMENCPFIGDCPIKTSIYSGFSMAISNKQRVSANGTLNCDHQPAAKRFSISPTIPSNSWSS